MKKKFFMGHDGCCTKKKTKKMKLSDDDTAGPYRKLCGKEGSREIISWRVRAFEGGDKESWGVN